jgi:IS1 family transposase
MNRLDTAKRSQIVSAIVEGCSIRSIVRMTGTSKNTIAKLLIELGEACSKYMSDHFTNLKCERLQVDELWSFVGCKQKNVTAKKVERDGICGDVWAWIAIDADTKLIPSFVLGQRDPLTARVFMEDLAGRLANRVQLTSDGLKIYLRAVKDAFGNDIDYAMLVKIYGNTTEGQKRYSPAECIGCETKRIKGNPDPKHVSTSYIERQNLTMRMHMRRFTRLTNGFSKKLDNHIAAVSLHFMYYNFVKIHGSLKVTPAMAAGVTEKLWEMADIVALVEEYREERQEEGRENARKTVEDSYSQGPALGQ